MVREMGSSEKRIYRFYNREKNTPKSVEEVVAEVMKINKLPQLFQTMVILSLNMGNLTLEVNTLKNKLAIGEKEKAMLQEESDKERDF